MQKARSGSFFSVWFCSTTSPYLIKICRSYSVTPLWVIMLSFSLSYCSTWSWAGGSNIIHSTGQTWNHSWQVISVAQKITGNITDMDNNPFGFLLSLEAFSGDSKISSPFFFAKFNAHTCLKSKEVRFNITSMWVNRSTTERRSE